LCFANWRVISFAWSGLQYCGMLGSPAKISTLPFGLTAMSTVEWMS
jgi:hypothetical protein